MLLEIGDRRSFSRGMTAVKTVMNAQYIPTLIEVAQAVDNDPEDKPAQVTPHVFGIFPWSFG